MEKVTFPHDWFVNWQMEIRAMKLNFTGTISALIVFAF